MAIQSDEDRARAELEILGAKLDERAGEIEKFERYYDGKHNLRFATRKFREAFGALFREFSCNYCGLVVDCTVERMTIDGFRFPTPKQEKEAEEAEAEMRERREKQLAQVAQIAAAQQGQQGQEGGEGKPKPAQPALPPMAPAEPTTGPQLGVLAAETGMGEKTSDPDAWAIWQRNKLDLYADIAHEQALIAGVSYLIVGPQDNGDTDEPLITVEHPLEVITLSVAGAAHQRRSALKRWYDEDQKLHMATVFLPDSIWKFQSDQEGEAGSLQNVRWVPRKTGTPVMENPFKDKDGDGIVPVIPLINRQKLKGHGRSELADIIPLQDALNKTYNDALVASEFAAFRQRILTGMEVPEDENGNIIPDFDLKASVQRIMLIKDKDVGVHEFQVGDLTQYIRLMEYTRDDIAAISKTPPQYLIGKVVNVSGDALKASESGHVSKVKRRSKFFGEGWEEALRLAFLLKGDQERAESYESETIWQNPEVLTESELADSLAKFATLGVPIQALWERMGASQKEIARWLEMLQQKPTELPERALAAIISGGTILGEQ